MNGIQLTPRSSALFCILILGVIALQVHSSPAKAKARKPNTHGPANNSDVANVLKLLTMMNQKPTWLDKAKQTPKELGNMPNLSSRDSKLNSAGEKNNASSKPKSSKNKNPKLNGSETVDIPVPGNSCGQAYNLSIQNTPIKLSSSDLDKDQYPVGVNCNWTFVGNSLCKPSISCKTIDLRETEDCEEDYVEITDGIGSSDRVCSLAHKVENLYTQGKSLYLFVNFVTSDNKTFERKYNGFECEVSCNQGKTFLQKSESSVEEDQECSCGIQRKKIGRVVGGKDAAFREFPWLVAIVVTGTRSPLCGGSIINSKWVLSAAHCFPVNFVTIDMFEILANAYILNTTVAQGVAPVDKPLGHYGSIRVPGYKLPQKTDEDEGSIRRKAIRIVRHPFFQPNFDFDVVLLEVDQPFDFHGPDSPLPVCLPQIDQPRDVFDEHSAILSGWGLPHVSASTTTRLLQKVKLAQISFTDCSKWLDGAITERMICAGYMSGGKDACQADSGGPLIIRNMKRNDYTQIGIVSAGSGCAKAYSPGVYSKITELLPWILFNVQDGMWCKRTVGMRF